MSAQTPPHHSGLKSNAESLNPTTTSPSSLEDALSSIDPRGDYYDFAKASNLYITREELLERWDDALIVDVRDDDHIGGHIKGSVHMPDSTFGVESLHAIMELLKSRTATIVTFHCMESLRRGPRCAKRFSLADPQKAHEVRVLEGGFDQWIRRYWKDDEKVQEYNDDYWGLTFQCTSSAPITHTLYDSAKT